MAEPIDGQVVHDNDEPGGERAGGIDVGGAAAEPGEIVLAERLAHPCEDVHHVVGFRGIVADRAEDEAAVTLDEEIPGGLGIARFERGDPRFRHGHSDRWDRMYRCETALQGRYGDALQNPAPPLRLL